MATNNTQHNTQQGDFTATAHVDLTGKEGYLLKPYNNSGAFEVTLPTSIADNCEYVLLEAGAAGETVTVRPLVDGAQVRLRLNGTCVIGDTLVPEAIDATNDGKVAALGSTAALYSAIGIAEEAGVDEQLVKCRVRRMRRGLGGTVTMGNTDAEISGLTIGATYSQSEVQALRTKAEELADDVRAIATALSNAGIITLA
jgi:hypothetical protein